MRAWCGPCSGDGRAVGIGVSGAAAESSGT
uniref:Uncharacterized protein n=1 Tax=Arundo donax TaxID=35708 RepID=A0A0A9FZ16_ARUDO